jgi:hypothetical protein
MGRVGAFITTLHSTSLRSRWLAVAFTMPARTAMNSLRAMRSRRGRAQSGTFRQFSAEHVATN